MYKYISISIKKPKKKRVKHFSKDFKSQFETFNGSEKSMTKKKQSLYLSMAKFYEFDGSGT